MGLGVVSAPVFFTIPPLGLTLRSENTSDLTEASKKSSLGHEF